MTVVKVIAHIGKRSIALYFNFNHIIFMNPKKRQIIIGAILIVVLFVFLWYIMSKILFLLQ
jgi:hypothetical protein